MSRVQSLKRPRQVSSRLFSCAKTVNSDWTLDAQEHLYHEVDVAVLPAEILHELLEPTLLSTHLQHIYTHSFTAETNHMNLSEPADLWFC